LCCWVVECVIFGVGAVVLGVNNITGDDQGLRTLNDSWLAVKCLLKV